MSSAKLTSVGSLVALLSGLAPLTTGCAFRTEQEATGAAIVVDERSGVLGGVRFGDSVAEVRVRMGRPTDNADGFFPEDTDFTGPPSIPAPPSDQRPPTRPEPMHYEDTAFLVSPTVGVYAMATFADGARTRAGIGVGDELSGVDEAYPQVVCGSAVAGEPLFGGDPPTYPWCRTGVGNVGVFFGGDPIESITLTRAGGGGG